MTRTPVTKRVIAAAAMLVTLAGTGPASAQEASFRPACELIDPAAVSQIVGTEVTEVEDSFSLASCYYEAGDSTLVWLTLQDDDIRDLVRANAKGTESVTIAGRDAVAALPPEGSPFSDTAILVTKLDDGGSLDLRLAPNAFVPADPIGALTAIAEAIFASGAVLSRPPAGPEIPPLGYEGSFCQLVTLGELDQITGRHWTKAEDDQSNDQGCLYTAQDALSYEMQIWIQESTALFDITSPDTQDVTIRDHPGVWGSGNQLSIDIGKERLLRTFGSLDDGTSDEQLAVATKILDLVLSRMTPYQAPVVTPFTGGLCAFLSVADLAEITGVAWGTSTGSEAQCSYAAADPSKDHWVAYTFTGPAADVDTAWTQFMANATDVPEPTHSDIAGHPATGAATPQGVLVIVDLDGTPGGDGQIVAVATNGLPESAGDPLAVTGKIAERFISHR